LKVCHSGLDPESSLFLDSCFHRNDVVWKLVSFLISVIVFF
jgi:hypothetical protein